MHSTRDRKESLKLELPRLNYSVGNDSHREGTKRGDERMIKRDVEESVDGNGFRNRISLPSCSFLLNPEYKR